MSKLSFITFCIEFYSNHIEKTSDEVYKLFEEEGLLKLLDTDYEDLHGMWMEYLMTFFDEYLKGGRNNDSVSCHYLIRATIIPEIVKIIMNNYLVDEKEALHIVYTSKTGELLSDDRSGLYGQSPLYIYSLIKEELANNSL